MRLQFDNSAPQWAHMFATALNLLLARNDARMKALEDRIKALENA
jgi:hypothetical protein